MNTDKSAGSSSNGNGNGGLPQRRFHRYLGLTASIFLVLLVVSGLLLQHQQDLGLSQKYVTAPFLLNLYGIEAPSSFQTCSTPHVRVTRLGETLFMQLLSQNDALRQLAQTANRLAGCVEQKGVVVLATETELLFYHAQGEFIEAVALPASPLRIGQTADPESWLVFETSAGLFSTNENALQINSVFPGSEQLSSLVWSQETELEPSQLAELQRRYLGKVLSWQQLLRDIHAGQILGLWGRLLLDVVSVGILLLACSGLVLWWRGRNR